MLSKLLNQKVRVILMTAGSVGASPSYDGVVTNIDDNFVELDNERIIAIKYITSIKIM